MIGLSMSFFTFMMYLAFSLSLFHLTYSNRSFCHDNERSALLRFKESLFVNKCRPYYVFEYPKVASWNSGENSDCCLWDGVKCNEETGHVMNLDLSSSCLYGFINSTSTLFHLVHLEWLSLAYNDFNESKIPFEIMNLSRLSHLNLSKSSFSGQIPPEMLELSNLESLDLSYNFLLHLQHPSLKSLTEKLTNLKVLDLCYVNISSSLPQTLTNLSSLKFLSLQECNLQGVIPSLLGNLTNLNHLDLFGNNFGGIIPSLFGNLTNLNYLDLSYNYFGGELPTFIRNLAALEVLKISRCNFSIHGPSTLSNLTQLKQLGLSYNNISSPSSLFSWLGKHTKFTGLELSGINIGEIPFWLMNLTQLNYLYMWESQLTGPIPIWLMKLNQLKDLDFSLNQLTGQIPSQISNLTQLNYLSLSSNQLQGPISSSLLELNKLEFLDLSSNNLSLELELFLQIKSLKYLCLSSNHLSVLITKSIVYTNSHKFFYLELHSCNLTSFPTFLRNQDQLISLDLSSNNISGQIPGWLVNLSIDSLDSLNLSHNFLTGFDQQPIVLPWTNLYYLDLRFNKLQGPLPIPPIITVHYLVSNNQLVGKISMLICKLNSLYALDLSNNNLSGKLPKCLGNLCHGLSMLDLQNNKFYGSIPGNFKNGTNLRMIDLSNNSLQGKIPISLVNCTRLEFLDLGKNKINDTFPSWMGSLPNLEVLNMQSNRLHGVIKEPKSDFEFPRLRLIDLSNNTLTGKFPSKFFQSLNAMKVVKASPLTYMMRGNDSSDYYYDYSLTVVNKGIWIEYEKIQNMLTGIWLSGNRFEGEIPASISILKGLRYLDLSNNNFIGGIPSSLSNLIVLESLVLSNNKLSGHIPQQLVKLISLAFFNVSYNHLEGPIPNGAQFNTFDNWSYEGNPGLCGQPLLKRCGNFELQWEEDDHESQSLFAFGWKIVAIGYASGLIIGVVLGHIFCTRKYEWLVKIFRMPVKRMQRKKG